MSDLGAQSYDDWLADRQQYWDSVAENNAKYFRDTRTTSYRSSDDYYANLGSYIENRQLEATPIAGEGFVEFFTALSDVSALGSKVFPPLRIVTLASRGLLAIEEFKN